MNESAHTPASPGEIVFLLKGYPRLSETFIAQEIRGLEEAGLKIRIVSLRHPTDRKTHPITAEIRAPVTYLPEYLWREPGRVLAGWWRARRLPGYGAAFKAWLADLRRDPTSNRGRRFGQALVLAAELPAGIARLHAHFLHTPASVARYAALMTGKPWSVSAHAKDIWTTPDWEKREKLAACDWLVTCTAVGAAHLSSLASGARKVTLVRHGLDLARFPAPTDPRPPRDGCQSSDPVVILSIGRAVEKKGFDDLLAALALLPADLAWRFVHIGGGPLLPDPESPGREPRPCRAHRLARRAEPGRDPGGLARRRSLRAGQPDRPRRRPRRPAQCADGGGQPGAGERRHPGRRHRGAPHRRRDRAFWFRPATPPPSPRRSAG